MKLSKITLPILVMSSLVIFMSGCGDKSKNNESKNNTNLVPHLESTKSEVETDYSNVIQTESGLEGVGYKFKYDSTTKLYSWDEDFREVYLKSLKEEPKVTDIVPVLENYETVLVNYVQKHKPSKGAEDVTIQESEAKAVIVRQAIDGLMVVQSKDENKPKDKGEEKKKDDKVKDETVKPVDSYTKSKKPVPVPKKKPQV